MYNIAYRITNNEMDAEDVLQEAFVSAFKNIHTYRGTASIGAWLKRIVINNSITTVKKRKAVLVPIEETIKGLVQIVLLVLFVCIYAHY